MYSSILKHKQTHTSKKELIGRQLRWLKLMVSEDCVVVPCWAPVQDGTLACSISDSLSLGDWFTRLLNTWKSILKINKVRLLQVPLLPWYKAGIASLCSPTLGILSVIILEMKVRSLWQRTRLLSTQVGDSHAQRDRMGMPGGTCLDC